LIQQVLQREVVRADGERAHPEVGTPMLDRLDEADQLALVGGQLGVVGRHGAAEEGQQVSLLVGQQHKAYQYVEAKAPLWLNELKDNQLMKPGEEI